MPQFLPKEAENEEYSITQAATDRFASEQSTFIHDVASKMAVQPVNDVGRVPSLFSRIYSFYTDLFPEVLSANAAARIGRTEARARARRQFRGIASVLALRESLSVEISLKKFNPGTAGNEFRTIFRDAYKEAPGFKAKEDWSDFQYLEVRAKGADKPDTLCGLSPYTLFFPAAGRISHCRNIFWYDNVTGEWSDPTTEWGERRSPGKTTVAYDVIKTLRGQMYQWLDQILRGEGEPAEESWKLFGLDATQAQQIRDELTQWREEISGLDNSPVPDTIKNKDIVILGLTRNSSGEGAKITVAIRVLEQEAGSQDLALVTGLPLRNGRVMLSKSTLTDPGIRICGTVMGKEGLEKSLIHLDAEGNKFVITDGETRFPIGLPYVVVDKLFLDTLHLLADGNIANNFLALKASKSNEADWWMFPFRPEMLRYLDLEKLLSRDLRERETQVTCEEVGTGENLAVKVVVRIGGREFSRAYSNQPTKQRNRAAATASTSLDVRVWPNFRFSVEPLLPKQPDDRVYYFRVRQMADWHLDAKIIATPSGPPKRDNKTAQAIRLNVFPWEPSETGWSDEPVPYRLAKFCAFHAARAVDGSATPPKMEQWEPIGLYFIDRGLCLFRLKRPDPVVGNDAIPWRIGVDFGTSNTCVSFASIVPNSPPTPMPIKFKMQTDNMQEPAVYERLDSAVAGEDTEGGAAILDFPYFYQKTELLTEENYFPSQFVTRQLGEVKGANFRLSNGLIFPRNVILDNEDIHDLLRNHPPLPPSSDNRPFSIFHNVKWEHKNYRRAFLWHLYKTLMAYASARGAEITKAAFSFPRAFDPDEIADFSTEVCAIFGPDGGGLDLANLSFMSESDAVQRELVAKDGSESYIALDVGGGTTDYLGVMADGGLLQASHYFAGSFINDYFSSSLKFQAQLHKAIGGEVKEPTDATARNLQLGQKKLLDDLLNGFQNLGANARGPLESYSQQAFFGLLGMMKDHHFPGVLKSLTTGTGEKNADRTLEQKAVCGFFHTLVLLYMGIVYTAGRLLRDGKHAPANLVLKFIGNGSKFYRFLDNQRTPFDKVLRRVFEAGYGGAGIDVQKELASDGKTFVANGLLKPDKGASAPVVADRASVEYFKNFPLAGQNDSPRMPDYTELLAFLDVLGKSLPAGKLDDVTVIPFCTNDIVAELKLCIPRMQDAVNKAERKTARQLQEYLQKASDLNAANPGSLEAAKFTQAAMARESRFIIHLKCLLDQIRLDYGR